MITAACIPRRTSQRARYRAANAAFDGGVIKTSGRRPPRASDSSIALGRSVASGTRTGVSGASADTPAARTAWTIVERSRSICASSTA
jgi:hypothetical protein